MHRRGEGTASKAIPIPTISARHASSGRSSRCECPCTVFTRPTTAFSKRIKNHVHTLALHYLHYNFCRIHQSLRVTPAMETGVTDRLWEIADIVRFVEEEAPKAGLRGPYKKGAAKSENSN